MILAPFQFGKPEMSIAAHLPPLEKISQEVIVQVCGVLIAAWLISRVPAFKRIVQGNTLNPLENLPQE